MLLQIKKRDYRIETCGRNSMYKIDLKGYPPTYVERTSLALVPGSSDSYVVPDSILGQCLEDFVAFGAIELVRGIAHWHPTWELVTNGLAIPGFGAGEIPDFDTSLTRFVPFAPMGSVQVSRGAAVSPRGMGAMDQMQFVTGYDKTNMDFKAGILIKMRVTSNHSLGFLNGTEIQVRGPVKATEYKVVEEYFMETPQSLTHGLATGILADIMPANPTAAESAAYVTKWGRLRN